MSDQHPAGPPPGRSSRQLTIAGVLITVVSGFLALVFFLATLLAANPCGAFGDACDDYGTTPSAFYIMLALTVLAIVASIVGLVLVVKGFSRRNRHATYV